MKRSKLITLIANAVAAVTMKRHLISVFCLLALGTVGTPSLAQERDDLFLLHGMSKTTEDLGGFPYTPTLRFTILGKGSIGDFVQIATVHFNWVGEEPPFSGRGVYLFEESSEIYPLDDDGVPTGDVIYLEACGVDGRLVIGAFGEFRITGGEGAYEGASGGGKVVNGYPGTYVGQINR